MSATDTTEEGAVKPAVPSADFHRRWPGFAPLDRNEADRFFGRDKDRDKIVRMIERPKSGQSALVWVHGPSGCGKTSLIQAGVCPKLEADLGNGFQSTRVMPEEGDNPVALIESIAGEILKLAPEKDELTLDVQGRLRQFGLLYGQDPAEAAEYLSSCFKRSRPAEGVENTPSMCLIFLDQLDRFGPRGRDLLLETNEAWLEEKLVPLLRFIFHLIMTGTFPIAVGLRSLNIPAVKSGLELILHGSLGSWVSLSPLDLDEVRPFFESAPAKNLVDSDEVKVEPLLLDLLIENSGGTASGIPFISETLRRLSEIDPAADTLSTADAGWAGGVAHQYSLVAESAAAEDLSRETLGELMQGLQKRVRGGKGTTTSKAKYGLFTKDIKLWSLVDSLVNARVLTLQGTSFERAEIMWTIPDALREWERAHEWLREEDRRIEVVKRFDEKRIVWEDEERSPVFLVHGSHSIEDAKKLIHHHEKRPFLSDELIEFMEICFSMDQRLLGEIEGDANRKKMIIGGAILIGVLLIAFLIWFFFFR